MKVINLDRLRNAQKIILGDNEYTVKGMTVEQFLNDQEFHKLEDGSIIDGRERTRVIISILTKLTNIPYEVLLDQELHVLTAIMGVANGIDPTASLDEEKGDEAKSEGDAGSPNE